ncbi:hypothetical protein [Alicyclobacillus acidocaldarius]|uniref:Uncharacterized protein n=1 Tax=Alicyclobacillus acidocaldarius (strain Tc-4-1) TaxID=1048834 RepID=F8IH52_ALIAT|nr:hypothetical protein [Alicyclobacillus acidocaldarius]AEJ44406.1 hypothetical protein TC41_2508 [Alicyclobacillus acidocaldarius subsp. acidocaldarius Tc-4-1]
MIVITPDASVYDELISEYYAACSLVERFNDPWSAEAARTLRFVIRILKEANSNAV